MPTEGEVLATFLHLLDCSVVVGNDTADPYLIEQEDFLNCSNLKRIRTACEKQKICVQRQ